MHRYMEEKYNDRKKWKDLGPERDSGRSFTSVCHFLFFLRSLFIGAFGSRVLGLDG